MNPNYLDIINAVIGASSSYLANPLLKEFVNGIKSTYEKATGHSMPGLLIQLMNYLPAIGISGVVGYYVVHAPIIWSMVAGLVTAFAATKSYDKNKMLSQASLIEDLYNTVRQLETELTAQPEPQSVEPQLEEKIEAPVVEKEPVLDPTLDYTSVAVTE